MPKPFMRGKNTRVKAFIGPDGAVNLPIKSHDVTREGTEHNDGVNGEQADRLDFSFTHYSGTLEVYLEDVETIKRLLALQKNEDAQVGAWINAAAFTFLVRDGSRALFSGTELVIDKWSMKSSGRTDAVMLTVPVRFSTMAELPS